MGHKESHSMKKRGMKIYLLSCLFGLFTACSALTLTAQEKQIAVLSVNDMHAAMDQFPRFSYMVDSLRQIYPDLLLISAGDNHSGNPINDQFVPKGYPMTHLMNSVRFDYSALGNHEFDTRSDLGYLTQIAQFTHLAANVFAAPQRGIRLQPSVIHTLPNGLKVALIGLLQLESNGLPATNPIWLEHIRFVPAQEIIGSYREMRSVCDAVVVVSHLGVDEDQVIARSNDWIDLIIGGHSHTLLTDPIQEGECTIIQSGSRLQHCSLTLLTVKEGGEVELSTQLLPIDRHAGKESDTIRSLVDRFNNNPFFSQTAGIAMDEFASSDDLGYFMADAHRAMLGADIAFQNRGGVRINRLPKGTISYRDIFSLDPFGNEMLTIELTPEEIASLIKDNWVKEFHSPIYASGVYIVCQVDKKTQECLSVELFTADKKPLVKGHRYKVAYNDYVANAYKIKHSSSYQKSGCSSTESLLAYLKKIKQIPSYKKSKERSKIIYR